MNKSIAWMLVAGLAITSVGCTSTGSNMLARGQGPEHGCPTGDCHVGHGAPMMHGGMMQGGPMMQGGMCQDGCWHGPYDGMGGMGGMNGYGSRREPQQHTIHYTTHVPQDLRYPPQNVPPTVVQYPYYTVKGPTDFFLQ